MVSVLVISVVLGAGGVGGGSLNNYIFMGAQRLQKGYNKSSMCIPVDVTFSAKRIPRTLPAVLVGFASWRTACSRIVQGCAVVLLVEVE